jgi:hypothetical protein
MQYITSFHVLHATHGRIFKHESLVAVAATRAGAAERQVFMTSCSVGSHGEWDSLARLAVREGRLEHQDFYTS